MESFDTREAITRLTLDLLSEPEFANGPSAGIVLQAYLVDSPEYLDELIAWAKATPRKHPFTIRLVKGAYWDHEVVQAAQHGWTPPVFTDRRECDRNFEKLTKVLIDNAGPIRVAIARHNLRSIAAAAAYADARRVGNDAARVPDPARPRGRHAGRDRRRPAGACAATARSATSSPGMAYLVRRLLENTANDSFLAAAAGGTNDRPAPGGTMTTFRNEPLLELRREAVRREALEALAALDAKLPLEVPMLIGDAVVDGPPVRLRRPVAADPHRRPRPRGHRAARRGRDRERRARPRRLVAQARRRARRRALARRRHPAHAAASSSPRWPSARRASRGPRPTPTSARRSTSSSTTRRARSRWARAARCCSCRASATRCATSPAASPA